MKTQDYRNLEVAELRNTLDQARHDYVASATQVAEGKEKNSAKLKGLRRDIARINTIINQKAQEKAK